MSCSCEVVSSAAYLSCFTAATAVVLLAVVGVGLRDRDVSGMPVPVVELKRAGAAETDPATCPNAVDRLTRSRVGWLDGSID
jgi:hypothetical protein